MKLTVVSYDTPFFMFQEHIEEQTELFLFQELTEEHEVGTRLG